MLESHLRKSVDEYADIIERIERLEIAEEELISKLKVKIRLFDATILYVREVWINDKIESYSYYWLRPDETLIMGWDNAPHHRGINSFPHHKHIEDKLESSHERNLGDVLRFIKDFLG
ncbi:MAG: hypothetical protein JSV88_25415 [Candidatus Aminicenantes bacterium]|nr:MAG: hypothetical protein JSV88_25415 [Candidatus Aminicenantes bacterium]